MAQVLIGLIPGLIIADWIILVALVINLVALHYPRSRTLTVFTSIILVALVIILVALEISLEAVVSGLP